MNILPRKANYADAKIEAVAQQALATDPMIADPAAFTVAAARASSTLRVPSIATRRSSASRRSSSPRCNTRG